MNAEPTAQTTAQKPEETPRQQASRYFSWGRENLEAIALAFIMALLIKCFFVDLYQIPSSSMEPTIMGSEDNGDRILVNKFYYEISGVDRFDVVVFKFPLKHTKNFIKRVVGLPDEDLIVSNGDIYTRKHKGNEDQFRIARKPLRVQESIWIELADERDMFADEKSLAKYWTTSPPSPGETSHVESREKKLSISGNKGPDAGGAGETTLTFARKITDPSNGDVVINDRKISFEFEVDDGNGAIFAEFETPQGRFRATIRSNGRSSLLVTDSQGREALKPLAVTLRKEKRNSLALMVFDGTAHVIVNGDVAGSYDYIDTLRPRSPGTPQKDAIRFGSSDLSWSIASMSIARDIHYIGKETIDEEKMISIDPGNYIMMGDNVNNSHDSRSWTRRTFLLKDGRKIVTDNNEAHSNTSLSHQSKLAHARDCDICRLAPGDAKPEHFFISGDIHGRTHSFRVNEIDSEKQERSPFVTEDLIMGKAFYVIWPRTRWFRLIR